MKAPLKPDSNIAYPTDLTVIKQVFDRVCRESSIVGGSRDADDLARAVMSLFGSGVHDEAELLAGVNEFWERRAHALT